MIHRAWLTAVLQKGHCPNPNGRPRKERPAPGEELAAVLKTEVPIGDGSFISTAHYLAMTLVAAAQKDPKLALKLLLANGRSSEAVLAEAHVNESDDDDAVVQAFYRRQTRQRKRQRSDDAAGSTADDTNDGEDRP